MAIEIKQLLIKSNIVQQVGQEEREFAEEQRQLKEETLAECRRMIIEMLQDKEER